MVYNNSYFRPTTLTEKLRAKFGERTADAILRASSKSQPVKKQTPGNRSQRNQPQGKQIVETDNGQPAEVLSFFGRADDSRTAERAIPTAKRMPRKQQAASNRPSADNRARTARPAQENVRRKQNARSAQLTKKSAPGNKTDNRNSKNNVRQEPKTFTGTFGGAYTAGAKVKNITSRIRVPKKSRYTKKNVSDEALSRGRSQIPGSRHAVLRSDLGTDAEKSKFQRFLDTFKDNRKAEHRVKKAPFPFAYATIVVVCALMAMILIFSHSEVNEYEDMINSLHVRQAALDETADKLELKLEVRDDIRTIESIAVDYIGMVNSDMATTKYVTVSAEDRVEILKSEEEEKGGLSALLSALGEGIGKFSEYFN